MDSVLEVAIAASLKHALPSRKRRGGDVGVVMQGTSQPAVAMQAPYFTPRQGRKKGKRWHADREPCIHWRS